MNTQRGPIKSSKIDDILPFSVVHHFIPQWPYDAIHIPVQFEEIANTAIAI